jgi:hypothetical protein
MFGVVLLDEEGDVTWMTEERVCEHKSRTVTLHFQGAS